MTKSKHGQASASPGRSEPQILGELRTLAWSPGFIYTLAHAAAANTFIRQEGSDPNERLSTKELTLMAGLLAIRPIDSTDIPDEEALTAQIGNLYTLLKKLHEVVSQPMTNGTMSRITEGLSENATQTNMPLTAPSGSEMVEPFFYVGTGAFDFQYLDLAGEKYCYDSDWLENNIRLSLPLMVSAARNLQDLRERCFPSLLQAQTYAERCKAALATFSFKRNDLSLLSDSEFEGFIERFAVTPGGVKHHLDGVGSLNELEFRPIMRLGEDEFFMPVGFMLAKAIYESPFFWMIADNDYRDQVSNHRGRSTEEIANRLLSPIFGDKVYRNVTVAEVQSKQTVHEIDVLALAGNRAVAIQAKSKRLTALSRQGDDEEIKRDFSQAVQEAYEQGLTSRQLVLAGEHEFLDREGNSLNIPNSLEDVYVACLTLDHFPALPYMTERFLEKGAADPYPVAMSILDLDILTSYLTNPLDFMHYIHQRSRWSGRIHGSCEMSFLGWYLNRGLALAQEVSGVLLTDSLAGLIDEDFPTIRGRNHLLAELMGIDLPNAGSGSLRDRRQNSELQHFINLLGSSSDPGATDAAFMLLDLSQDVASYFRDQAEQSMRICMETGQVSSCSILLEDRSGLSFVWIPDSPSLLQDVLYKQASALKYKHKSNRWIGLAAVVATSEIAVVFSSEPWQVDVELEELALLLVRPGGQSGKPDLNQLCWCGSGQKYKKCHL